MKSNQIMILICGKPRAGKTTVGEYIQEKYAAELFHLGSGIRKVACAIYGNHNLMFNDKYKDKNIRVFDQNTTPRKILQNISVGIKNICGQDIWCKKLYHEEIKYCQSPIIVIDDYRFPENYDYFHKQGYKIMAIKIERKNANHNDNNECENQNIRVDYIIRNNSSFEELYKNVDNLMKKAHLNHYKIKYNNNSYNYDSPNKLPFWEWMTYITSKSK